MAARTPSTWNVEDNDLLNAAFVAMAVNWPRTQREDLAQYLSDSLFAVGSRDTPWEIANQTSSTVDSVSYFKMFIRLYDESSVWFRNLRILQVRVKLRLDDSYHVARGLGNSQLGKFAAKIEAIRAIVETERLIDCSVPELVRQPTPRDFPNLANERAMSAGLRARRNRARN